jgi:hypothetical protein
MGLEAADLPHMKVLWVFYKSPSLTTEKVAGLVDFYL